MHNPATPLHSDPIPDLPNETWRTVQGYGGRYLISSMGRVKSFCQNKARILKPATNRRGYLHVCLWNPATRICTSVAIHRVVMSAFVGPLPTGQQTNHIDGDKRNNSLQNLEFVTPSQNLQHAYDFLNRPHVRGEQHGSARLSEQDVHEIRHLIQTGVKITFLGAEFGVSPATIYDIRAARSWAWLPVQLPNLEVVGVDPVSPA